jgi:hypothetical protein
MALVGELTEWLRGQDDDAEIAEGRFDLGGGDMVTAIDYQPSGHDSQPVPGDFGILVPASESGSYVIAGWVDPSNAGFAKAGEARLYARDSDGAVVAELHVTADGEVPDGIAEQLIARADRVDAELEAIKTTFNSIEFTVDTSEGTGTPGEIGTPYVPGTAGTGCDKVYVT